MASLKSGRADCAYPPELAVFDPARWTRHEWHLARAYAAPTRLDALNEIRASVGVPPLDVWPAELRIGARRDQMWKRELESVGDFKPSLKP